jgi:glutamine amidotransferase
VTRARVAVLDYGSGNLRSAVRALERAGADVTLTADPEVAVEADGLVVPGVGAFAACMSQLRAVHGPRVIGRRLAGGRPVLGICVGMQVLFELGVEHGVQTEAARSGPASWSGWTRRSCRTWAGTPSTSRRVDAVRGSREGALLLPALVRRPLVGAAAQRAARPAGRHLVDARQPFVAAVENGPLAATQFHPEKSGDAGSTVLRNWLRSLP